MVVDAKFEGLFCQELERKCKSNHLVSWVKNDHLDFKIWYSYKGEIKIYYPDFILKYDELNFKIIELKGFKKDQDEFKWNAIKEWVIAINNQKKYGSWDFLSILNKDDFNKI